MTKPFSDFYRFACEYLITQSKPLISKGLLTPEQLQEYTTKTDIIDTDYSLTDAFRMLLICMQDYKSMPKIIKYKEREEQINKILCNLDTRNILDVWTVETLYKKFCDTFPVGNQDSPRNCWLRYTKGILSAAAFMSRFETTEEFKAFLSCFTFNEYTKEALPLLLSEEIFGIKFALACNWLKELGLTDYPKPDVHMIKVFSALGICNEDPLDCYKAMLNLAKECSISPYNLDKVVWLICSGNYYRHNVKLKATKLRDRFIEEILKYEWI